MEKHFTYDPFVHAAYLYAAQEHGRISHKRMGSGLDYIHHPVQVALYVLDSRDNDPITVAVALNHDVLEDTRLEGETIMQAAERMAAHFLAAGFDEATVNRFVKGVLEVTDVSKPEDGNRKARKAIDNDHAALAHPTRMTVKLADIKSNMPSIVKHKPGFDRKWCAEKRDVYGRLGAGDPVLFAEVGAMLQLFEKGRFNVNDYDNIV